MNDPEAKVRLINCLLILRHYTLVEEKKIIDLTATTLQIKSQSKKNKTFVKNLLIPELESYYFIKFLIFY